jgi:two-component system KDP operon response regulator KdpE
MSTAGPLILIVEDEPQMRRFLRASLTPGGYRVLEATTGAEANAMATMHNPELILLDLGLPDRDGLEVLRRLREWTTVPVIVLSARGREPDKIEALDAGADDYLTKPFGTGELIARIRVALRHAQRAHAATSSPVITVGPLRIDLAARVVTRNGTELHLTPIEYRLLVLLAKNAGKVLTHRQILLEVWGPPHAGETHYVRVYMGELRKKIEDDPMRPKLLVTEPGVGYRLREA